MATFYGGWVATDDFRAILEATVSNTSDTQCEVELVLKVQSNYAYAGSSGRASVTCNGEKRSDSVSYSAGKTTTLMTESFTVARGSNSKSISVSGKVWQLNASSAYASGSTASGKVTIPAIDYDVPNAPSSCSASRVSDTSAKVTWENGGTSTTKPRSSTKIERQVDGGEWEQIASVGASAENYTDNSVSANHRYRYRVRASGAGGNSGYSTSGYIYTTPAAPASVTASVVQGTTVRIAVDGSNAPWADSWEVQSSLNGGDWQVVGTYTSFPVTADIGGGTVRLRARSLRGSLVSAWTESAEITTITPPLAPAVTVADGVPVVPTGTDLVVSWVPNHPDGSAQTQVQVEYTVGGGEPQTATIEGTATSYILPTSASASAATVSVRVRTKGADEDWGAWSSPVSVTVAVPPSVYFSTPPVDGAAVGALPLTVEWDVTDSTGVASQSIVLLDSSGKTLYSTEPGPDARELVLGDSTYRLSNTTEYMLRITVRGGSSLTATAERSFRTSFAEPARPTAQAETDPSDMSVAVSVQAGAASSASGEVIEVSATPGTLVPGLTVYGATRQNLWSNPATNTSNGVTVTANDNGSITLSGTSTGAVNVFKSQIYSLRPGSTYTLSVGSLVTGIGPSDYGFMVQSYNGTDFENVAWVGATTLSDTFTVPSDSVLVAFTFTCTAGQTVSGTYYVMLNKGDTAEPWCPPDLNGVDELSVVTAGKNLIPITTGSNSNGVKAVVNEDGSVTLSGTSTSSQAIDAAKSGNVTTLNGLAGRTVCMKQLDSDSVYLQLNVKRRGSSQQEALISKSNASAVIPDDIEYVNLFVGILPLANTDVTVYPQVELGSTPTAYEPPAVTTTPIDLDGHTLNSLPDGTRDELHIDGTGAVTLVQRVGIATAPTAAGSWEWRQTYARAYFSLPANSTNGGVWDQSDLIRCDKLPVAESNSDATYTLIIAQTAYAKNPAITSAATAATVAGGATYLYPLADPQEVELPGISMPSFPADPCTLFAASDIPCAVQVDYPDTESLAVTRVLSDGARWLVADGLADGEQAIDPLPPLNVPYTYEVTASTEAGSAYTAAVEHTVDAGTRGAYNFGPAATECLLTQFDFEDSGSADHGGELYHFAGQELPLFYAVDQVDVSSDQSFHLIGREVWERCRELFRKYPVCWLRKPDGDRQRVAATASIDTKAGSPVAEVSVSGDEIVFEEAW